jgi:hypothetical protein
MIVLACSVLQREKSFFLKIHPTTTTKSKPVDSFNISQLRASSSLAATSFSKATRQ